MIVNTTIVHDMELERETRSANGAHLDAELLRPSAAMLGAQIALGAAIERGAVDGSGQDSTTVDLLLRLHLAPGQELRGVDLCEQLLLSPSHISRRLDRAERDGLVQRRPDPDDRRASRVRMTATGEAVIARFVPRLVGVLEQTIYRELDSYEVATLVELLDRVETAARTCPAAPGTEEE